MRKKVINLYAKTSELMNIEVIHNGKSYIFNMFEELSVTEEIINKELKEQASSYFFLTTIHRTLAKRYELLEARKKKLWAQLYTKYKSEVNELTKRPNSDDSAKYMVEDNSKYYKLVKKTILVKNQMEILASAVKAFEQRKDTIQSLSANLRKEQ